MGSLGINKTSRYDPMLSYVVKYRSDKVECLVADFCVPFTLYAIATGRAYPLPSGVVPGRNHNPGHRSSDQLLGSVPAGYCEGPSPALDKKAQFVFDSLVRVGSDGLAAASTSRHGPKADEGSLNHDDD